MNPKIQHTAEIMPQRSFEPEAERLGKPEMVGRDHAEQQAGNQHVVEMRDQEQLLWTW